MVWVVKVLVIGSGAREHALVQALTIDPTVTEIHAAPGNAGISRQATLHFLDAADPAAVSELAQSLDVDLVVIGPEVPLVSGVADAVRRTGVACFGPSADAAQLEASKSFAKQVMQQANVPTAKAGVCTDIATVAATLDAFGPPHVVKDDGLAAGKGVVVTNDRDEALEHATAVLAKEDGRVVIEEFLNGPEVSLFCLTDGVTVVPLQPAQDFKRVGDGDAGPNTGGMGAYTPLPWAPVDLADQVVRDVAQPTVDEMMRRGTPFSGLLYVGLAMTSAGMRVIEFNARFGDPETQVVLAQLKTPVSTALFAAAIGRLADLPPLEWHGGAAVTVVIAAEHYPGFPKTGDVIEGLDDAALIDGVHVLHAGTAVSAAGGVVSSGGRVLSVVARGADLTEARNRAYQAVALIKMRGAHYRTDIGLAAAEGDVHLPTTGAVTYGPLGAQR